MSIPFTQYLMPDGRTRPMTIDRPAEIERKARDLIEAGYRFEIEVLMTEEISMEIVKDVPDPDINDSLGIEVCFNGPSQETSKGTRLGVPEALDKLVTAAWAQLNPQPAPNL